MNQILYSKSAQKMKIILIIIILVLLIILGFFGFGIINVSSNKIFKGVLIDSINVGNLTKDEAANVLKKSQEELDNKRFLLTYESMEVNISGEAIDLNYNDELINKAYAYGRSGNIFSNIFSSWKSIFNNKYTIDADFYMDKSKLSNEINILLEREKAIAQDDTYEVSGDKIIIMKGHDGVTPNVQAIMERIIENADSNDSEVKIEVDVDIQKANRIDFNKIYRDIFIPEKDASYTQKDDGSVEYVKETIGISFDRERAKTIYSTISDGTSMEIEIVKSTPNITTSNLDDVLFGDVLATYKTTYNASNKDRSTNLEVAARNINETVLLPGEEFSYNKEVGQRTYANGFKDAHIFSGGKVVDGLGGGICQISSTLYNAVLMANLEITERKNHMMYPEYVKPSLDATVVWGSIDFKFKNNRETPIKIVATVNNGTATTTIYGKKVEGEPIVEIESVIEKTIPYTTVTEYDATLEEGKTVVTQDPVNGYISKAYKILKDENGKQISKTLISSDTYRQTSKIVTVGTKKVHKPIEVVTPSAPEQNVEKPTVGQENIENNEIEENNWPSGWDTPENPFYTGN